MRQKLLLAFVYLLCSISFSNAQLNAFKYTQNKVVTCSNAAVVTAHPLASQAGISILKQGGNAVDAAIATQLALAVVFPNAGNVGGGGFLIANFNTGKNITIDYREKAPGKAYKDMYLDETGNPIKNLSLKKQLASGVPGTVAGLFASMKYAKLDFKILIEPAIQLAEKGFAITASQANDFNTYRDDFIKANKNPVAFVKMGEWKKGDVLIQKDLAATLKRIRDAGMKGFYKGKTAALIIKEMRSGNGIISLDDLKKYRATERKPVDFTYNGFRIITMPLPSSGGIILQQMLKMVEDRNIGSMGFQTKESVQLMIEAERRAYADRAFFLGDPDFVKVPVEKITDPVYLRQRMNDFIPGVAGSSIVTKEGMIRESEETTHVSIIDKDGNAVSVTTTLNDSYGSKTVVSGAGFILNNEMDDFSVKPGHPNMYGATGNAANAIAPYKRMLSSMTPAIVLKDNKPFLVVGTPGGTTIPTSVFQSIVNVIDFKLSAEDAVNLPKFHHQWLPDSVYMERTFSPVVMQQLKDMGYKIRTRGTIGRTEMILIDSKKRNIIAVADKRGDDGAEGY
ncbi:MAG: gamma-glutamyltransferase [Ferruginibacter sp.]